MCLSRDMDPAANHAVVNWQSCDTTDHVHITGNSLVMSILLKWNLSFGLKESRRSLRNAQNSLVESEQEWERRTKLMRKTHKTVLDNKQNLSQDL